MSEYKIKGGYYVQTNRSRNIFICLVISLLFNVFFIFRSVYKTGQYRAQSEYVAELEQRNVDLNERIERTTTRISDAISESSVIIPETINSVGELREILQNLEISYNNLVFSLSNINSNDNTSECSEIEKKI